MTTNLRQLLPYIRLGIEIGLALTFAGCWYLSAFDTAGSLYR